MVKHRKPMSPRDKRAHDRGPLLGKLTLDLLMPMHLWVGPTGHVLRAGPTLKKLCPDMTIQGQRMTELLEFKRPRNIQHVHDLYHWNGQTIQVQFRHTPRSSLKGIIVNMPRKQGVLINLSLGITVVDMVQRHGLTSRDFAATDPTIEMLYLVEAQSSILDESKNLNARLQAARVAAEEQAFTDTLTGLKNRRALDHAMGQLMHETVAEPFGLMHLDLDYFKAVNDTHGHAAGDHVLQVAARIFLEETRGDDIVARIGGDEFVLLLKDCNDLDRLNQVASRIIARLEEPITFEGGDCRISASIGTTASSLYERISPELLARDADAALYTSKNNGRSQHTVFVPRAC